MEAYDLFDIAYLLCDEWKQSEEYQSVTTSLERLTQDLKSFQAIERFCLERDRYSQVEPYGKHHPDFKKVSERFIEAKTALYENPLYQEYSRHLGAINDRLGHFSRAIEAILDTCLIRGKSVCQAGEKHG